MRKPDSKASSESLTQTVSPVGILRLALNRVPALKYALGVAGIAAAIAIVRTLVTDLRVALFGIILMLILMTVLFIFAKLTSVASKEIRLPAMTLVWFSLLLLIASASLLFTSVFFEWPVNLRHAITGREAQLEQPSVNNFVPSEKEASSTGRAVLTTLREFPVEGNYVPSGKMGDTSDVRINEIRDGARRFTYVTHGEGPHQWEYRYDNDEPAQFAGVMYLSPPNAWGTLPDCGYDLRGFHSIAGEARSLSGPVNVNFVVGGIDWFWDEKKRERVKPSYGDSMRKSVPYSLTEEWKPFRILLDEPEDHLKRVVGGFGWSISWGENQVEINGERTSAENVKTFIFEIRNIKYLKDL